MSLWASGAFAPSDTVLEDTCCVYHHHDGLRNLLINPRVVFVEVILLCLQHLLLPSQVLLCKQVQAIHKGILTRKHASCVMWAWFTTMAKIKNVSLSIQ
jgi:hypothetical protein